MNARSRSVLGLSAVALAAPALLAAALAQGGRRWLELDILTHVAPVYFAAGLLALILAVVARTGPRPIAVALASMVASGSLLAPEFMRDSGPTAAADAPGQIKIIQFNAWVRNARADEAARWILSERPDIVVLEEGWSIRARLMSAGYEPACFGCAPVILARCRPIRRFPPPRVWNETSGITHATYRDVRGEFTIVAVHGRWPTEVRKLGDQRKLLRRHMAGWPRDRVIMAGDFNSTPWSFARRRADREMGLVRRTRALFSWPADRANHYPIAAPFPFLPIDHIYAGNGWATVSVRRGPRLGSDHYPIVAVLAPVTPKSPT